MVGFYYPNEAEVQWGLLIVIYPFITGLVAGAFIVSALHHVFGLKPLQPVARFSLLTALAFLLVAPLPLLVHLGRPERAFEIFLTPNFTSAMAGFGYIWLFYLILVSLEVWLVFRRDIVAGAESSSGWKKLLFSLLTLGSRDISPQALASDARVIKVLAFVGIPSAGLLHGYVGFIFGAIKANPWWSTPLMPVIFLLSAIVSGIALLILLYCLASWVSRRRVNAVCLGSLTRWLMGFLVVDIFLEGLEIIAKLYESEDSWDAISQLLSGKLAFSFFGLQLGMGALLPLFLLAALSLLPFPQRVRLPLSLLSASLVLGGVFAMRWNVVIGGQLLSKSLGGFLSFQPVLLGQEGVLVAGAILMLPVVLWAIFLYLLPPWEAEEEHPPTFPEPLTGYREATLPGTVSPHRAPYR